MVNNKSISKRKTKQKLQLQDQDQDLSLKDQILETEILGINNVIPEDKPITDYSIFDQWKFYLRSIHFKVLLNKKYNVIDKMIRDKEKSVNLKENYYSLLTETEKQLIFKLSNIQTHETKEIYLQGKDISKKTIWEKLGFPKFDGYIFFLNKAEEMHILRIKNMRFIYDLVEKKQSYFLVKKIGTYKGKPFFLVKYPIALSLHLKEDDEKLYYDAETLYNYVNIATKGNLTNLDNKSSFSEFLQKNIIWIVILILIIIFLMTPQGKQMLANVINNKPGGTA